MKRPISLTIVGATWFLIGVLGMVGNAFQEHGVKIPDGNFFNIFVGIGLLSGWRICRWYALFVTGFAFVLLALFLPWAFCNTNELVYRFPFELARDQRPHQLVSLFIVVLYFAFFLFASGWTFLVLKRNDVRNFFTPRAAVTI